MKTLTFLLLPLLGVFVPGASAAEKSQAGPTNHPTVVSIQLGTTNVEMGVHLLEWEDGKTAPANIGGSDCRTGVRTTITRYCHLYFALDESFKSRELMMDVLVMVEYFDSTPDSFTLHYDGNDRNNAAYSVAVPGNERLAGTQTWRKAYFICRNAKLTNSQNRGADFRVQANDTPLYIRRLTVLRLDELGSDHLAQPVKLPGVTPSPPPQQ